MKTVVLCLWSVLSVASAQAPRTEREVLVQVQVQTGIKFDTIDELRTGPPENTWRFFAGLAGGHGEKSFMRDFVRRAGRAIAENEEVGELVQEQMSEIPHDFHTSSDRTAYLLPLGYIPAPWSARILGQYLMDETEMKPGDPNLDYSGASNQYLAVAGLTRLGFSDIPTRDLYPNFLPGVLESWREWWLANENRVEERIREINPDYGRSSAETEVMPQQTQAQVVTPVASASPSLKAEPASGTSKDDKLFIYLLIGGALLAVVAIGVVAQWWRGRPKRFQS